MNASLLEIANGIKSTGGPERAAHVKDLIAKADALGEALTTDDVDGIASTLSPIGELNDVNAKLRQENNPDRIRTLMASAMKLRNQMRVGAK
ncbi:MAG TPA: hypothetical protein VFE51_14135 [Verrucomicrobiae bacterium]|nr:hypothetical protein [Verrucomicrobiae bacterium]